MLVHSNSNAIDTLFLEYNLQNKANWNSNVLTFVCINILNLLSKSFNKENPNLPTYWQILLNI